MNKNKSIIKQIFFGQSIFMRLVLAGLLIGLLSSQSTSYVYGQRLSNTQLKIEINKLEEDIKLLTKKRQEEASYQQRFVKERKILIAQKKKERSSLARSLNQLSLDLYKNKNQVRGIEIFLNAQDKKDALLKDALKNYTISLMKKVKTNIPFEQNRRSSLLNAIVFDLEAGKSTSVESFNRILKFLTDEETIAYDSETLQVLQDIKGQTIDATLLRIGRVYFALDTPDESYLYYQKKDGSYHLDLDKPLTLFEKRNLKQAIMMVQGKKAPSMILLPWNMQNTSVIK